MKKLICHFLLCLSNVAINFLADFILQNYSKPYYIRYLCDSLAHGLSSGICWFIIELELYPSDSLIYKIFKSILCAFFASFLDVDHFIEAKSFQLQSAVSLQRRPFLHNTTLMIVLTLFLSPLIFFLTTNFGWIFYFFIIIWFPHHCRDANRRGFWIWPLGHTFPLPFWIYTIIMLLSSYCVIFCSRYYTAYAKVPSSTILRV